MAIEILSGVITGPYLVESDDVIIVSDDADITSDEYDSGALENDVGTGSGVTIIVDGKIKSPADSGDAIRLHGEKLDDEGNYAGNNLIQVREDGVLNGSKGIFFYYGQNNTVDVAGRVVGYYSGIHALGGSAFITVSGTVAATLSSAIYLQHANGSTISNTGTLTSGWSGIWASKSASSVITNSGLIHGDSYGIGVGSSDGVTVLNSGMVKSTLRDGCGIKLIYSTENNVENTGTIKGYIGVYLRESTGSIFNSGRIVGEHNGILVINFSGRDDLVTIHNTGVIKGEYSLHAWDSVIDATNLGVMNGDIYIAGAHPITLKNAGRIVGEVRLGLGDDTYRGIDDGYVTRFVHGREGQDILIGGARHDDLRGGDDDDLLRGKGGSDHLYGGQGDDELKGGNDADRLNGGVGNDLLQGGNGDDTLKGEGDDDMLFGDKGKDVLEGGKGKDTLEGGKGNDTLTGGGGADVFVFGTHSGTDTDTVLDFTDGTDFLRLVGHTGGFDDLTLADTGADLSITHDGGVILLTGLAGTVLTAADFEFV